MTDITTHPASFRDPAGFVFTIDGIVYRQVNQSYARQYDTLMNSGLYDRLVGENLLIPHTETPANPIQSANHYKTLLPSQIRRLGYPSEWCPEQLKDAALVTLKIQRLAMDHGMTLKDATPFNIQFDNSRPVFIDTLSFETYDATKPWIAYRQFCECFLFPLYLHHYTRIGTHHLSGTWPEGIPVTTTARLMPIKSRWNTGAWLHVFLHNRISSRQPSTAGHDLPFSKSKLTHLIEHLQSIVTRLNTNPKSSSAWSNYYDETILDAAYLKAKQQLFEEYLQTLRSTDAFPPADALDLGCNDGLFSKILAETGLPVIAIDSDWACINKLYREHANILPLCVDLANPTPASGFANAERTAFTDRAAADLVVALALIHHLALRNNIPLPLIADYLARLANKYLLIEFIPLSDPKAKDLVARKDMPPVGYDIGNFEAAFGRHFTIKRSDRIPGTERQLYLLTKT